MKIFVLILFFFSLLISSAKGQTTSVLVSNADHTRMISLFTAVTDLKDGVVIRGFVIDPNGVKTTEIRTTTNRLLATCPGDICNFLWLKTDMKSGFNDVMVILINNLNAKYQVMTQIGRP